VSVCGFQQKTILLEEQNTFQLSESELGTAVVAEASWKEALQGVARTTRAW
jgi:hypothetical protein